MHPRRLACSGPCPTGPVHRRQDTRDYIAHAIAIVSVALHISVMQFNHLGLRKSLQATDNSPNSQRPYVWLLPPPLLWLILASLLWCAKFAREGGWLLLLRNKMALGNWSQITPIRLKSDCAPLKFDVAEPALRECNPSGISFHLGCGVI
ncbi:hypothetical protein C8R46DRAFT_276201 [Mycena filopes]|nr:hypothetical protein C8R46DRAFT_276201 [Mycena filopes]